jgi:release factor glutamine methyltransferase
MTDSVRSLVPSQPLINRTTIAAILSRAGKRLRTLTDAPQLEAELILSHVLDCRRADLHAHPERSLRPQELAAFQTLLDRRALGEPLPYLTGHIEFYGLDFNTDPRVLIPRPETETLVELALTHIARIPSCQRQPAQHLGDVPRLVLADVGTGSGCLAVTLAVYTPRARIYALDLSSDALAVARANAQRHRVASRITFIKSDLLTALPEPADLIVANPPYIASEEWPTLPQEVREHEPRLALYGGPDGLDIVRRLLREAPAYLRRGGAVFIEIGAKQGPAAIHLARQAFPAAVTTVHPDLAGRDRVLCVRPQQ